MKYLRHLVLGAAGSLALLAAVGDLAAQSPGAEGRRVVFSNKSQVSVTHLYAAPSEPKSDRIDKWELLGASAIEPGKARTIDFRQVSDACLLDVRVVGSNGREKIYSRLNVCFVPDGSPKFYKYKEPPANGPPPSLLKPPVVGPPVVNYVDIDLW